MRTSLLAGVAALALWASDATAASIEFRYTGSIVGWTVPESGTYIVAAARGQGGPSYIGRGLATA